MDKMKPEPSAVDELQAFPFLNDDTILNGPKQELPSYLAKAADVSPSIETLTWWEKNSNDVLKQHEK